MTLGEVPVVGTSWRGTKCPIGTQCHMGTLCHIGTQCHID